MCTPVNLLLSSQQFQGNLSKIITFAVAPLVLTPFVRNQGRRAPPGRHLPGLQRRDDAWAHAQLPRVEEGQLGHPLQPPRGLHARVHHGDRPPGAQVRPADGAGLQAGDPVRGPREVSRGLRKGTNGVSTNGVTANIMFFDRGTFWVITPVNLLLSSQKC